MLILKVLTSLPNGIATHWQLSWYPFLCAQWHIIIELSPIACHLERIQFGYRISCCACFRSFRKLLYVYMGLHIFLKLFGCRSSSFEFLKLLFKVVPHCNYIARTDTSDTPAVWLVLLLTNVREVFLQHDVELSLQTLIIDKLSLLWWDDPQRLFVKYVSHFIRTCTKLRNIWIFPVQQLRSVNTFLCATESMPTCNILRFYMHPIQSPFPNHLRGTQAYVIVFTPDDRHQSKGIP